MTVNCRVTKQYRDRAFQRGSYQTACTLKDKPDFAKLVAERCVLQRNLNRVPTRVLMDTGAQVSIIKEGILEEKFLETAVKAATDLPEVTDALLVW